MSISLAQANQVIAVALSNARAAGFRPMGIAVLDESGNLKAFAREDGASMFRYEIALAKAWGAAAMGVSSRVLGARAADNPNFFVSLAATAKGRFLPQTGALVIRSVEGNIMGAVGASGGTGEEDEQICAAGIAAVGLLAG